MCFLLTLYLLPLTSRRIKIFLSSLPYRWGAPSSRSFKVALTTTFPSLSPSLSPRLPPPFPPPAPPPPPSPSPLFPLSHLSPLPSPLSPLPTISFISVLAALFVFLLLHHCPSSLRPSLSSLLPPPPSLSVLSSLPPFLLSVLSSPLPLFLPLSNPPLSLSSHSSVPLPSPSSFISAYLSRLPLLSHYSSSIIPPFSPHSDPPLISSLIQFSIPFLLPPPLPPSNFNSPLHLFLPSRDSTSSSSRFFLFLIGSTFFTPVALLALRAVSLLPLVLSSFHLSAFTRPLPSLFFLSSCPVFLSSYPSSYLLLPFLPPLFSRFPPTVSVFLSSFFLPSSLPLSSLIFFASRPLFLSSFPPSYPPPSLFFLAFRPPFSRLLPSTSHLPSPYPPPSSFPPSYHQSRPAKPSKRTWPTANLPSITDASTPSPPPLPLSAPTSPLHLTSPAHKPPTNRPPAMRLPLACLCVCFVIACGFALEVLASSLMFAWLGVLWLR
ncbi:hypothetical protein C7M84_016328 [Penaeus vannamei]|uniref:Uncharacterized protein n=1 Tax=Penaeus vannamei TaxID=6689 RepID=A0A3R7LVN2_PENVA|nr:hypothetical protein C7M84_016328 [Penaeus vannamei]